MSSPIYNIYFVPGGRLELPRVAPLVPKTSAYTNSAIPAILKTVYFANNFICNVRPEGIGYYIAR